MKVYDKKGTHRMIRDPVSGTLAWMSGRRREIEGYLRDSGLDQFHVFDPAHLRPFLEFSAPAGSSAVLVGNTAALWDAFSLRLPQLRERSLSPLETYVEEAVGEALSGTTTVYLGYSHQLSPAPIPIQRICEASGFADQGPVGLNVHPEWGPWFALRAVAVIAETLPFDAPTMGPCRGCPQPCVPEFERAIASPDDGSTRRFLPVRDSCPIGRHHRYSEEQIAYHYDRKVPID